MSSVIVESFIKDWLMSIPPAQNRERVLHYKLYVDEIFWKHILNGNAV